MPNPVDFRHDVLVALAEEYVATDYSEDALDAIATIAQNLGIVWDDNSFYLDFETEVEIVYANKLKEIPTEEETEAALVPSPEPIGPSENMAEPEWWDEYPAEHGSRESMISRDPDREDFQSDNISTN